MHTVRDAICAWDTRITDGCLTQTGVETLLKHSQHTLGSEEGCRDRNSVYVNMCSFFAGEKTEKNQERYELSNLCMCGPRGAGGLL